MQTSETVFNLRLWNVEEYHRMAASGILDEDERVELLEGKIIWMSAKGTAHASAVARSYKLFVSLLDGLAWIISQDPIALNQFSEPEPDISIVKIDPLDYADHHPTTEEIYLIIEVADSSLKFHRQTKSKSYAKSGIRDYWVLDVINRQLYVLREPGEEGYQQEVILDENAMIFPLEFPGLQIQVKQMLPPVK
ncbi:Uma2 family endonuclease [Plectonema cf. radiosum LEGE 06105]|uniref:Uma2 family endonuclease n=1 Tax=Plectonema cf. radiosum LEGE 06105 TaxID=945769 RepID=A0A8J7JYZ4_9CYAN|nr:Uma2 family endonuclease [Plectonema radiosum]MBE9211846.1 Uma2 family endonuclease [Plectonema cf. radiosum LEGE 06105]